MNMLTYLRLARDSVLKLWCCHHLQSVFTNHFCEVVSYQPTCLYPWLCSWPVVHLDTSRTQCCLHSTGSPRWTSPLRLWAPWASSCWPRPKKCSSSKPPQVPRTDLPPPNSANTHSLHFIRNFSVHYHHDLSPLLSCIYWERPTVQALVLQSAPQTNCYLVLLSNMSGKFQCLGCHSYSYVTSLADVKEAE